MTKVKDLKQDLGSASGQNRNINSFVSLVMDGGVRLGD
jgi:hypothetical protein